MSGRAVASTSGQGVRSFAAAKAGPSPGKRRGVGGGGESLDDHAAQREVVTVFLPRPLAQQNEGGPDLPDQADGAAEELGAVPGLERVRFGADEARIGHRKGARHGADLGGGGREPARPASDHLLERGGAGPGIDGAYRVRADPVALPQQREELEVEVVRVGAERHGPEIRGEVPQRLIGVGEAALAGGRRAGDGEEQEKRREHEGSERGFSLAPRPAARTIPPVGS